MAKSNCVDADERPSFTERYGKRRERLSDFWSECEAYLIERRDAIAHRTGFSRLSSAVKGGAARVVKSWSNFRWGLNARVAGLYEKQPWLAICDARVRKASVDLRDHAVKAYADMSWARVALLTIFLMALIGTADSMVGRPVSFRLIYMLPIWVATRLGGGGSGFIATLIVGIFCTIGDTPFEASRQESQALNFAVRWMSLGGFLLIVLQVEGALHLARQRATRDALTGLPNRYTIETMAEDAIDAATTKPNPIHLALIDCDNFKVLNDENGHAFGDHALKMLGKRLETETRSIATVGRLGGDEFIVLFQGVGIDQARKALEAADSGFRKMMASLDSVGSMSFGIATNGEDGSSYARLCRVADERMYSTKRAKASGLACVEIVEAVALKSA